MIVNHYEQGGLDWIYSRLGIPTASQFSRIVTPKGALSKSRDNYGAELLAERFTGEPYADFSNEWTERGQVLEPDARRFYEFTREATVEAVGTMFKDESMTAGGSPDGLVGEEGGLELKCPDLPQHLKYLALDDVPSTYVPQVQGSLWISGRRWWDFMSYFPGFPPLVVRVAPDPVYQEALTKHMPVFVRELEEETRRLIGLGLKQVAGPVPQ